MAETSRSGTWIGTIAVIVALAILWDALKSRPAPPAPPPAPVETAQSRAAPPPPQPSSASQGGNTIDTATVEAPSYFEQLARSETRRRIRGSGSATYLNEMLAASRDSSLHRWVNRYSDPVRVRLTPGTVANYQPAFLDAIRDAFATWARAGVPVRFDVNADTTRAEVTFQWNLQFNIERTGQTDLQWDKDGHIHSALVTIATFDPRGRPLGPDDVRAVALHEIGHVLGLDHSSDSTDLMFAKATVRELSRRDVRTAALLYELTPGDVR
jgi:predicted Zn-dependent protease